LPCIAKEVLFEQTALNNTLHTELHDNVAQFDGVAIKKFLKFQPTLDVEMK